MFPPIHTVCLLVEQSRGEDIVSETLVRFQVRAPPIIKHRTSNLEDVVLWGFETSLDV